MSRHLEPERGSIIGSLLLHTGLDVAGAHEPRVQNAVDRARRDAGASDVAEYADLVGRDRDAYNDLIDRLTVGETYFFREPAQMALVRSIASRWAGEPGAFRLWSAGCATGEEPYTLAILMEQAGLLDRCRITGTDISERSIDRARAATYGKWSLRRCDPALRGEYFEEQADRYRLRGDLADAVEFSVHNLMDGPPSSDHFDLVLCRNVLIYVRDDAVPNAAETLRDSLRPGGWLIVGSSDPLLRVDGLALTRADGGLLYQRAAESDRPTSAGITKPSDTRPQPVPASVPTARRAPAQSEARTHRRRTAPVASEVDAAELDGGAEEHFAAISAMAGAGDVADVAPLLEAAIAEHPLDASLRRLAATLHLHAQRPGDAANAATAAVYLEPESVLAHMLLGRAEDQRGHPSAARRSFLNALELLAALPPDSVVPGTGGERAGALAATAAASLNATKG